MTSLVQSIFRQRDIIPCHVFADYEIRLTIFQLHLHRSGRVRNIRYKHIDIVLGRYGAQFVTKRVVTYGTNCPTFRPILGRMICKINRCTAGLLSVW